MNKFIIIALISIFISIVGIGATVYMWFRNRESYENIHYPYANLVDVDREQLAGSATYSDVPYIDVPSNEGQHPTLKGWGPSEIRQNLKPKYVYSDNPIYNFK